MSRLYEDLRRPDSGKRPQKMDIDDLELFAYNKRRAEPPPARPAGGGNAEASAPPKIETAAPSEPPAPVSEPAGMVDEKTFIRPATPLYRPRLSPFARVKAPPSLPRGRVVFVSAAVICSGLVLILLVAGLVKGLSKRRARAEAARQIAVTSTPRAAAIDRPEAAKPALPRSTARAPISLRSAAAVPARISPAPAASKPAPAAVAGLTLGGKGMTVKVDGSEQVVTFESGLFSSNIKLSREGERTLSDVAAQLKQADKQLVVTVVGCTDNIPVNPKKGFRDNTELGMQRAAEVARFLQVASGLPARSFKTVSYGTQWSPYSNDTPQDRARNRTAVLRISTL